MSDSIERDQLTTVEVEGQNINEEHQQDPQVEEEQDNKQPAPYKVILTFGYCQFENPQAVQNYFVHLAQNWPKNLTFNEYEFKAIVDLVRKGHPTAQEKIGDGIKGIQIRKYADSETHCYHLQHLDNSWEDFSYLKCLSNLYPKDIGSSKGVQKHGRQNQKGGKFKGNQRNNKGNSFKGKVNR